LLLKRQLFLQQKRKRLERKLRSKNKLERKLKKKKGIS
jgi:hypothetical protein